MDNNNRPKHNMSNRDQQRSDKHDEYQALWQELEPRLAKPRKRHRFIWFLCFALVGFMGLWIGYEDLPSTIEQNSELVDEIPVHDKQVDIKSVKLTPSGSDLKFFDKAAGQADDLAVDQVVDLADDQIIQADDHVYELGISNAAEQAYSSKSIAAESTGLQDDNKSDFELRLVQKKHSSLLIDHTQRVNSILNVFDNIKSKESNNLAFGHRPKELLDSLQYLRRRIVGLELPCRFINLKPEQTGLAVTVVVDEIDLSLTEPRWILGLHSSLIFFNQIDDPDISSYQAAIDGSLSSKLGASLQVSGAYTISKLLRVGLGLNYSQLVESFSLTNEVSYEAYGTNPEAFLYEGNFIAAEQDYTLIEKQNIRNYNSYHSVSLVPQISVVMKWGKGHLSSGIGLPIIVYQNYSGTLFDQNGLRAYEGIIFDNKSFGIIGLQLYSDFSYRLTPSFNLDIGLSYRRFRGQINDTSLYQQRTISAIGLNLGFGVNIK